MFKRIILCLLVVLACKLPDDPPPVEAALLQSICQASASGCSASYGAELGTTNNATDSGGTETDATTGWTQQSTPTTFDSINTAPSAGTYHLAVIADAASEGFYRQLSGTTPGQIYRLQYDSRHTGSGGNYLCSLAWNNFGPVWTVNTLTSSNTDYATSTIYYQYAAAAFQYLLCRSSSTDGGMYLDKFTVKPATLCLGSERFTDANAASVSNEANSIGSIATFNSAVVTSETTDPQNGSYHLRFQANGNNNAMFSIDLNSLLTTGKKYFFSWKAKIAAGDSSGCGFGSVANTIATTGTTAPVTSSWTFPGVSFTYGAAIRYWGCKENGSNNNSDIYIDQISIKEITAE